MGGKGSGNRNFSAENTDPELNSRSLAMTRALLALPKIDLGSVDEINARMDEYFALCNKYQIRALVGNFALSLGVDKNTLGQVFRGDTSGARLGFTPETITLLKRYYVSIESNFEQMLVDSKTPVAGIYYTKAMLGWRETPSETVVTHKAESPRLSGTDIKQIADKYKAIAGVVESGAEDADGEEATYEVIDD
jgi:hypothetical protein